MTDRYRVFSLLKGGIVKKRKRDRERGEKREEKREKREVRRKKKKRARGWT